MASPPAPDRCVPILDITVVVEPRHARVNLGQLLFMEAGI